ncbi:MAG TPA: S41 family peptidase [Candidatus Dormibacteraeota bacterium]|nr:S41 family peptidase [Candidatus Dormibacteraeota bacterium]
MAADPSEGPLKRPRASAWSKLWLALLTFPVAFYLGALAEYHAGPTWDHTLAPAFFSTPSSGFNTSSLQDVWNLIQRNYARTNVDPAASISGADKGLVSSLNDQFGDRFSTYFTPDEIRVYREQLSGSFGGIGATMLGRGGQLVIATVIPKTPADRAGLKSEDVVTQIDGKDVGTLTVDGAVAKIRGPIGTHVGLTIVRAGKTLQFDITRDAIPVPTVRSRDFPGGILYLRLYMFGEKTPDEFESALKAGLQHKDRKIILDMRGNPGGFVSAADFVTSEFVKSGLNVTVVGRGGAREQHPVSGKGIAYDPQLVVLVDGNSASAAEIVSGALLDHKRAYLIGQKTFGKGSVQEDFDVRTTGGDLHLTIAYWYTPDGHSIERNGITPNQVVALASPQDFYEIGDSSSDPAKDAQLQAALAHLR